LSIAVIHSIAMMSDDDDDDGAFVVCGEWRFRFYFLGLLLLSFMTDIDIYIPFDN